MILEAEQLASSIAGQGQDGEPEPRPGEGQAVEVDDDIALLMDETDPFLQEEMARARASRSDSNKHQTLLSALVSTLLQDLEFNR